MLLGSELQAQCPAVANDLVAMAHCVSHLSPEVSHHPVDVAHHYALSELIEMAEVSNPRTRIAWAQARAAAEREGLARSEYLPHLAGMATFLDQKIINPFPRPYAPQGYTMVEMPVAEGGLQVGYTLLDFGRRHARLEQSKAEALAETAHFERENQEVAFKVITGFYHLIDVQQMLKARQQILETARTIQSAAEAQLTHGRATLPDVLDARAGTARAEYELEEAVGEEQKARVALRESLGVTPSDAIQIETPAALFSSVQDGATVEELVEEALKQRPDLVAFTERMRASREATHAAQSAYLPTIEFHAKASAQSIWPTVSKDHGSLLADTTHLVWDTGVTIHWDLFDAGARRSRLLQTREEQRKIGEEQREAENAVTRAAWSAWVDYRTAQRRMRAADELFTASESSYRASLEAYNYGVKNLIDLVHAEQQLAEARLATVEARSRLETASANLGYTTGALLRSPAHIHSEDGKYK